MAADLSRRAALRVLAGAWAAAFAPRLLKPAHGVAHARFSGERLRFAIQTWQQSVTWGDIAALWEEADDLGIDAAFTFDHFIPLHAAPSEPCLEAWTLLSALAARTRRIRVGTLVTGNTYRYPAVLAKMAATVDHVSGGRLILGMGAGWYEAEHDAYGIPFRTAGIRARRLVEAVEVVKLLFTKDRATFEGKYYRLKDAPFVPKPLQKPHPPILIGGMGPKVIQPLAARHADIWHFSRLEPEQAREVIARFDDLCRKAGRDPAAVTKAMSLRDIEIGKSSAAEIRARVRALAGAGIGFFVLSLRPPYDRKLLKRFGREVAAELRKG